MTQQTPKVFEVDASQVILDRLVGLHQFISPELVRQAVHDTGRRNRSDCRLTHEVMLWVVLAMGILTDVPLRQVFNDPLKDRQRARRSDSPGSPVLHPPAHQEAQLSSHVVIGVHRYGALASTRMNSRPAAAAASAATSPCRLSRYRIAISPRLRATPVLNTVGINCSQACLTWCGRPSLHLWKSMIPPAPLAASYPRFSPRATSEADTMFDRLR